jgi:hypothetical protein
MFNLLKLIDMKKIILCGSALLLSLGFAKAQWSATGAHDDFATTTQYANGPNGEGLSWFVDPNAGSQLAITRPGDGTLKVAVATNTPCHNAGVPSCYPYFGVTFGALHGQTFVVNTATSTNADVYLDIENKHLTQSTYIAITLVDSLGNQSTIEPNVSDVLSTTTYSDNTGTPNFYYHRKALNGFTIAANTRVQVLIDLSSVPSALGGLTPFDNDGNGTPNNCDGTHPYTCPETAYILHPSIIKGLNFAVNFGDQDINLSQGDGNYLNDKLVQGTAITAAGPFAGNLLIHEFRFGSATLAGTNEATVIDNSLKVYPNPAKESITVDFTSTNGADVSLTDIVGNKVVSTSATAGDSQITMNTSGLPTGMYILNVTTENGKAARKVSIK